MSILDDLSKLVQLDRNLVAKTGLAKYYFSSGERASISAILASIGEGDVTVKIMNFVKPPAPPPPVTVPPTPPVAGAPSVVGGVATIVLTPGFSAAGIDHNEAWLGSTSGTETFLTKFNGNTFISAVLPAGNYFMKFKAADPTAVGGPAASGVSTFSNEVSFTVGGALGADTYPPADPGSAPTVLSGGASTLPTLIECTPTADNSAHSGTQVVTGTQKAKLYLDKGAGDEYQVGKDALIPSLGSFTLSQIGNYVGTPGTKVGSAITSCTVLGGKDAHWSNIDGGFTYWWAPATGHQTIDMVVTDADGGPALPGAPNYWNKPLQLEFRNSLDPQSPYRNVTLFNKNGAATVISEGRDHYGADATQTSSISFTLPCRVLIDYDPATNIVLVQFSQNTVTPSWSTLFNAAVPDLGAQFLLGIAAAGNDTATSATWSSLVFTTDTKVRFAFTGMQQIDNATTWHPKFSCIDGATPPNESGKSPAATVTYSALPNGGGGGGGGGDRSWGGGYYIGGSVMNHNSARAIRLYAQEHRTIMSAINNWEGTFGTTMQAVYASIRAKNPQWKGPQYLDSTRTQTDNFFNAVWNFRTTQPYGSGWCLVNGDGSIAYWGDQFGHTVQSNPAATAQDNQGRSIQYYDPLYRRSCFRIGGTDGLSSIGMSANLLCAETYWDDWFGGPWIGGLFTPGNVGAAVAMQEGWKAMFTNWRNLMAADNTTGEAWANISQALQNMSPSAIANYAGCLDGGLCENIGSAIDSTWTGSNGLINLWQTNQLSVVKAGGYPIFQTLCSPFADANELRRRRVTTAFSQIFGNSLINLQYDPVTYYVPADQLPVRPQFFDVNRSTGQGNPNPYDSDYFILGWTGDFVSGAAGAIQTYLTPYSGSYVFRREKDYAVFVACASEAPGTQYCTFSFNLMKPNCTDDGVFNGQVYPAGTPIPISPGDGFPLLKV